MGYHNEHHDFAGIPWNNLPRLKELAPDYYDGLASYRSWTAVLLKFIFDPSMTTYSRVVRAAQDRKRRPPRARAVAPTSPVRGDRSSDTSSFEPAAGAARPSASTGAT
jgi:hypothetical protein